jgi:malonyl-CoA O-methyltransferase
MDNPTRAVREGYDRWAVVYDHDSNPLQALEGPVVRKIIGEPRGLKVLDLGCGTGRHALWLAERGAIATAVDFSEGMLAEARHKTGASEVRFIVHDLHEALPFPAGTFDLVVSGLVLEHLRVLDGFFAEVRRILKSDGRAVISAMHPAMFLRGGQARFTDPASGEVVQPGSVAHTLGAFVMEALRAGLRPNEIAEHAPDEQLAATCPRAAKYVGWPMLVVLDLTADVVRTP